MFYWALKKFREIFRGENRKKNSRGKEKVKNYKKINLLFFFSFLVHNLKMDESDKFCIYKGLTITCTNILTPFSFNHKFENPPL